MANSEQYLIGLVMGGAASASTIGLKPSDFTDHDLVRAWDAALNLETSGNIANSITVSDFLTTKEIEFRGGGKGWQTWSLFLDQIGDDYGYVKADEKSIKSSVDAIKKKSNFRKIVSIAEKLSSHPDKAADAIQALINVTGSEESSKSTSLNEGLSKALAMLGVYSETHGLTGAVSGINALDDETGGFQPTDFIVIGARSQMGKTAFALTCMLSAARKQGKYSGFISTEMPDSQIGMRYLASESGVNVKAFRNGTAEEGDWAKIGHAIKSGGDTEKLVRENIKINDSTTDWDAAKAQIRAWCARYDMTGGIWIDYLQNMRVNRGYGIDKIQEAGIISSECKSLAKELNVPIIGLSQLQRTIDEKSDKRPTRANLSWAAQIENDADLIILLYRHEVYYKDVEDAKGVAEIIIDKFRNGEPSKIYATFRGHRMDFKDIDDVSLVNYHAALARPAKQARDF